MKRIALCACCASACGDNLPPPAPAGPVFAKHVIDPAFRSEGVTIFDVNHDGYLDLVTEELWYAGPGFEPHEVRVPRQWDPLQEYAHCFGAFHEDVDGDGWDDLLVFGPPGGDAFWCANPQGAVVHCACHPIAGAVSGESPLLGDVFGDGRLELVMGTLPAQVLGWVTPGTTLDDTWLVHPLTDSPFPFAARYEHGNGLGDVNGDGRLDILTGSGWLEQPADPAQVPWPFHEIAICPNNCAHMFAFDLDGDGRADLVGSSPHHYGVAWWQQLADGEFVHHLIDDTISQTHALRIADFDGDGLPELVTGKRWAAHFRYDPGSDQDALLVMYKPSRTPSGDVTWQRIVIDDNSGIGSQFEIADVNGDGKLDIVVSNKLGLNYFEQR